MNSSLCFRCNMDINIRNPSGYCDHLQYRDYCKVCKKMEGKIIAYINFDILWKCDWWTTNTTGKGCPFPFSHGIIDEKDLEGYE